MCDSEILTDPCDEVILESALNYLMEKVGRNQLVDISTREIVRERLPQKYS